MFIRPKPPPPFIPNFEQLEISRRTKDDAIEQRLRPSRPPLPTHLPPADELKVKTILSQRGVVSKFAKEQVTDQDISRLKPCQWLNDEIINFYGALILSRAEECKENPGANGKAGKEKSKPLNAHYFSTFFWSKLTKEGYDKGRLAKWTKKVGRAELCISLLDGSCGYRLIYSQKMSFLSLWIIAMLIGRQLPSIFGKNVLNHTIVWVWLKKWCSRWKLTCHSLCWWCLNRPCRVCVHILMLNTGTKRKSLLISPVGKIGHQMYGFTPCSEHSHSDFFQKRKHRSRRMVMIAECSLANF